MFREHALAALRGPGEASVLVAHSWRHSAAAGVAILLAAAFVAFCVFGKITRKATISGVLLHTAGVVGVRATEAGQVIDVRVKEGGRARAGDVLLVIGTERTALGEGGELIATAERAASSIKSRGERLEQEKSARIRYFVLRMLAAADRVGSLAKQGEHAKAEAASHARRAELAASAARTYAQLATTGFVSRAQHQQREEEALDAASRLEAANRAVDSLASDKAAASAEIEALREQMRAELAAIGRALESNREEAWQAAARKRLAITAPADGVVSALALSPGQMVQQGEMLFGFLPDGGGTEGRTQVQLFAPGRAIGFTQPGQAVNLRFDAFPFQKFGMLKGIVASISRTPYAPAEIPSPVPATNEPMYRVLVDIEPAAGGAPLHPLAMRPGMSVSADVLLETRAVWEWALEPLIAIHKKS
jgi:membrane fusion protein